MLLTNNLLDRRSYAQKMARAGIRGARGAKSLLGDYYASKPILDTGAPSMGRGGYPQSPDSIIQDITQDLPYQIGQGLNNAVRSPVDTAVGYYEGLKPYGAAVKDGVLGYFNAYKEGFDNRNSVIPEVRENAFSDARNRANNYLTSATVAGGILASELFPFTKSTKVLPRVKGPSGSGPDTPSGPVTSYKDVPIIDPRDLIGAKIHPTLADLMATGRFYQGIDAAGTTRETPLGGGPLFPLQKKFQDAGIAWLNDSQSVSSTKLNKDSDFLAVAAMSPDTHKSNAATNDAYLGTLEAYIKTGRLQPEQIEPVNQKIRDFGKKTTNKELKKLENFIGFDHDQFPVYMRGLTFPQRAAISNQLQSSNIEGFPSMQKVLDETIEKEFAGTNLNDTLLLLELDKKRKAVDLREMDGLDHMAYNYGVFGDVVGRFKNPLSRGLLFPDFENEYSARPTMLNNQGLLNQNSMQYAFGKALPVQTITSEGAQNMHEALQYHNIAQPRQAQLVEQALNNNWKSSLTPKNMGGVGHTDYQRAIERNPSLPSLEPYKASDLKSKDFEVQQLGNSDIYFGLQKNPDYTWMNNGNAIPELGKNEIDLVGVISNEIGAKGVASPAVLGKAIEDGATVLNAFAVPSKKFPNGFLPKIYKDYGFKEIKRIPFNKEYYVAERGKDAYDDLLRQWSSEGWTESEGFPDVTLMKWSGTNEQRKNASKRVFEEDFNGFGSREDLGSIRSSRQASEPIIQTPSGRKASGPDIRRGNTGQLRGDSGPRKPSGIQSVTKEIEQLTPLQRQNLGLLN
jgi:hypothetical protein